MPDTEKVPVVVVGEKYVRKITGIGAEVVSINSSGRQVVFAYDGCLHALPKSEFTRRFKIVAPPETETR